MLKRKNYFYKAVLFDVNEGKEIKNTKEFFCDIINNNSSKKIEEYIDVDGKKKTISYFPLDVSQENEMHVTIDVFNFDGDYMFFRACKQKPSNSFNKRNYSTYTTEDFSIDNENNGIEQYTFGYYVYSAKIFSIIKGKGTPDQKILNRLVNKYRIGFNMELIDIPNKNGVEVLYRAKESQLSQIEIEIPSIDLAVMEKVFGWKENELIELGRNKNFKVNCVLKSDAKRAMLSTDDGLIKRIIDAIRYEKTNYSKAQVRGKIGSEKIKDYNFFDENFSNDVSIRFWVKKDGGKKYYPVNQMVDIYKDCLIKSYNENDEFLSMFGKDEEMW